MKIAIRQETEADYSGVYQLNAEAFGQEAEAKLVDALRISDAFIPELSLIATIDNTLIGHILFTKIKIRNGDTTFNSLALAPMAVSVSYQNKGIGSQLVTKGLHRAKMLGYSSVIVLGHKEFYPKFGFVPADKWHIRSPYDVPTDVFMGIELTKNGLKGIEGTVEYAKEFENV
jgi:predicted N-acetyltransferase YhbS